MLIFWFLNSSSKGIPLLLHATKVKAINEMTKQFIWKLEFNFEQ